MHQPTDPHLHSPRAFARFGIDSLVYVKRVVVGGTPVYALHAADGTELLQAAEAADAVAVARQHDFEPVSVH